MKKEDEQKILRSEKKTTTKKKRRKKRRLRRYFRQSGKENKNISPLNCHNGKSKPFCFLFCLNKKVFKKANK